MRSLQIFSTALLPLAAWGRLMNATELDEGVSPLRKVVKLLREMSEQLEAEAKKDEEIAGKLDCWCGTNLKEKEAAIANADNKTKSLMAAINEAAGSKGKLTANIAQAKKELSEAKTTLARAEKLREKERKEFEDKNKELVLSIANLKNALQVLRKVQGGFLQMTPEMAQGMTSVLHNAREVSELHELTMPTITKASFLQAQGTDAVFLQAVSGNMAEAPILSAKSAGRLIASFAQGKEAPGGQYNPQSGSIVGILSSMLDTFKANLGEEGAAEEAAQDQFKKMRAAKQSEIAATEKALAASKEELANANNIVANGKEELEETANMKGADIEFLRNLKVQCQNIDREFAARQKERANEQAAVSDAISILTDDDNRDLMSKTTDKSNYSFVQMSEQAKKAYGIRQQAAAILKKAGVSAPAWEDLQFNWAAENRTLHPNAVNPKKNLAAMAVSVQLDAFTKVKKAMDDLTADIKTQIQQDVKDKESCGTNINDNVKAHKTAEREHTMQERKIDSLEAEIETLKEEIAKAETEIKDQQVAIKQAGEDREKENKEFQTTVVEQRETQVILKKAIDRLAAYYKKSFLQVKNKQEQTPPVEFGAYNKNAGASPVLAMLAKVMDDSKAIESEAVKDEAEAQAAYEQFVGDANKSISTLSSAVNSKTEAVSVKGEDKAGTETDLASTGQEIDNLESENKTLHEQCDFLLANFDLRQTAMKNEVEAIAEAKAILSGMK